MPKKTYVINCYSDLYGRARIKANSEDEAREIFEDRACERFIDWKGGGYHIDSIDEENEE